MGWKLLYDASIIKGQLLSQSAFAGYGLEADTNSGLSIPSSIVAIRFRWIWVGRTHNNTHDKPLRAGRNPLSLDMGWKTRSEMSVTPIWESQSAFAGYGLEEYNQSYIDIAFGLRRNPLSLDMGWKLRPK